MRPIQAIIYGSLAIFSCTAHASNYEADSFSHFGTMSQLQNQRTMLEMSCCPGGWQPMYGYRNNIDWSSIGSWFGGLFGQQSNPVAYDQIRDSAPSTTGFGLYGTSGYSTTGSYGMQTEPGPDGY